MPQEEKTRIIPGTGIGMAFINAGSFVMGSPETEDPREKDEKQHRVMISRDFWMAVHELTQADYALFMSTNPSRFIGMELPVESVSWEEAAEFCEKLNRREQEAGRVPEGYCYRLPTESEWEYACRAGTLTAFSFGNGLSSLEANFDGTYPCGKAEKAVFREKTLAPGRFSRNAWHIYDMHGNVWEWCLDWYWDYPGKPAMDPKGPPSGSYRVIRGGGYFDGGRNCRSAERLGKFPKERCSNVGFRVALAPRL